MAELTDSPTKNLFKGWPMIVFWAAMLIFAGYACTHMVAAGDTWVAMACGRHFVDHGVDTVEPFSANSHDPGPTDEQLEKFPGWLRPVVKKVHPTGWVNQNWLTHVIFYKFATTFGADGDYNYDGLVYWKFLVTFLAVVCTYFVARLLGVSAPSATIAACLAILAARSFIDIRPAVFSNLMVPLYLLILVLATYKNIRYIWLIVPLIVFWCNVHGGYIYAFIMMVPFVGLHLLLNFPKRWTLALFAAGTWGALYLMTRKFMGHEYYILLQQAITRESFSVPPLLSDPMFYFILAVVIAALVMARLDRVKSGNLYAYLVLVTLVVIFALIPKYVVSIPLGLSPQLRKIIVQFVNNSQISFAFVVAGLLFLGGTMAMPQQRQVKLELGNILQVIAAGAAAFVAMIIFNPFHLTNLTHTFEISVSEHAASWRSVNEWHPAFERDNPVGDEEAFIVMFAAMLAAASVWFVLQCLKPRPHAATRTTRKRPPQPDMSPAYDYKWPSVDPAYIGIAGFTVYMALSSRRFIPLAALAAYPLVALFFEQAGKMTVARTRFSATQKCRLPQLPPAFRLAIVGIFAVLTLYLGTTWGAKYKRIYLDPWPNDALRNSVFMRMSASNVKPFEVMQFVRENNMSGKMFNHWTEGGAVAFGQTPDPETGRTPLQLFMDGRAQAAYNHDKFMLWQEIKKGGLRGPVVQNALNNRRRPRPQDVKEVGEWVDARMKEHDVWVILMPANEFNSAFMVGIQTNTNWRTAFMDDYQMLLINIKDPRGKQLLTDILEMKAKYPDEFTRNLAVGKNLLLYQNPQYARRGFEHAKKAFELSNSQAPMQVLVRDAAGRHPELADQVTDYVKLYVDKFAANRAQYAAEAGYTKKLLAAMIGANYLAGRKIPDVARYRRLAADYEKERVDITIRGKW